MQYRVIKYILLLSLFSFLTISCSRKEDVIEPVYCSLTNPWAACENPEEICYKGACIIKTLKCEGNIDAPCPDGDECKRDEETRDYKCFEGRCTINNKNGYCVTEGESCYHGYCNKPCSLEVPRGGCDNPDEVCFDSTCLDGDDLCSNTNPNGKCNPNNKCTQEEDGFYRCLELCHKKIEEDDETPYEDMPCLNSDEICVEGECLHIDNRCSVNNPTGECPSTQTCVDNTCQDKCSLQATSGICPADDQVCVNGTCDFKCGLNHPEGFCSLEEVGEFGGCEVGECKKVCGKADEPDTLLDGFCEGVKWCNNGECAFPCDIDNPTGTCKSEEDWCNNGTCEKQSCSEQFPNGYCPLASDGTAKKCVNNVCIEKCSSEVPTGWCDNDLSCYQGLCKSPLVIPCIEPNGSYCTDNNFECIANQCILKPCAIGFNGRCEQLGDVCYTITGECISMCSDYRRIVCKEGETPEANGCINLDEMGNSSVYSACCSNNEDCLSSDSNISIEVDNKCIDDGSSRGAYCNKIGLNACNDDSMCNDSYPYLQNESTPQDYYCSSYNDIVKSSNISFCERVKEDCSAPRDKNIGQFCNEDCKDSECALGTHCIDGICTIDCTLNNSCPSVNNGKQLECSLYSENKSYPGYLDKVTTNICRNTCSSNKDCKLPQNECNNYFNQQNLNDENLPLFSTCGNKKEGSPKNTVCTVDEDCSSKLCVEGTCSEPCSTHEDCGTNAYCDYDKELVKNNKKINYIGVCRYLATATTRKDECNSTSECLTTTVTVGGFDRHYKCLQYTDSTDTTRGICGIQKLISGGIPSFEGGPCFIQNTYCESGLCITDSFNVNVGVGKCRELCSSTSDCGTVSVIDESHNTVMEKQICKRIKFRDGTPITNNNIESYGGVCSAIGTPSLDDCSVNSCISTETCILNPINSHEDINEPWKFNVEYLCIDKKTTGASFGSNCNSNDDCQSSLCSILTNKCTSACTNNNQCLGLGSETCNTNYPAVYDINQSKWVLGGVCE
jgi:hypothetical protein